MSQSITDFAIENRSSVVFTTPGLIDLMSIKTFGVSAKITENPIGFFGTGIKYALAVLLREGLEVTLWRGNERIDFDLMDHSTRGKDFKIVRMGGEPMAFTTALGRNWPLWAAFRELWCNTKDEGGEIATFDGDWIPEEDGTAIVVSGRDFVDVYKNRDQHLLEGDAIWTLDGVDVHRGESRSIFYRGIKVGEMKKDTRSIFTYNITNYLSLTEDRTVAQSWEPEWRVAKAIMSSNDPEFIRRCLTAREKTFEADIDFTRTYEAPGDVFKNTAMELSAAKVHKANKTATAHAAGHMPLPAAQSFQPDASQTVIIKRIIAFLNSALEEDDQVSLEDFSFFEALGTGVYVAEADGYQISREGFMAGIRPIMMQLIPILCRRRARSNVWSNVDAEEYQTEMMIRIIEKHVFGGEL